MKGNSSVGQPNFMQHAISYTSSINLKKAVNSNNKCLVKKKEGEKSVKNEIS